MGALKTVGIVAKRGHPAAVRAAEQVHAWLRARDIEVLVGRTSFPDGAEFPLVDDDELGRRAELLIVLGGDGTLIHTAALIRESATPIFGVNLGTLGFLTEIELSELYGNLEQVFAGEARFDKRMRLQVRLWRGASEVVSRQVLNDAVVTKGALSRIIDFEVTVDGTLLTTYKADGIIVATPTGSTAYNLAAGGPVLHPTIPGIIITPICPHGLTHRPIVMPDDRTCRIRVLTRRSSDVYLTLDGQEGHELIEDDVVEICRSAYPIRVVRSPARSFFSTLREKLKWGQR